jgi:hypothetical protein
MPVNLSVLVRDSGGVGPSDTRATVGAHDLVASGAVVNAFLVFEGRAGSGLLLALLNSSPEVRFEAEWMLFDLLSEGDDAGRLQAKRADRYYAESSPGVRCRGIANKLSDIADPSALSAVLDSNDARVISLKRHNLAKQALSGINALRSHARTGKVHAYSDTDIVHDRWELDLETFGKWLRRQVARDEAQDRFVVEGPWESIVVFYEDLVTDRAGVVRAISGFLDIDEARIDLGPSGAPIKQTPTDLRELLTNFDELLAGYEGTPYHDMLSDPGV